MVYRGHTARAGRAWMREDSAHMHRRVDGVSSEAYTEREVEFDEYDGYSPIARLERRCLIGLHHPAEAVRRSASMWGTGDEYQHVEARLGTRNSSTDLARDVQYRHAADGLPKRNSCSDVDTTILSEMIAESKGSIGDRYVLLPGCNPCLSVVHTVGHACRALGFLCIGDAISPLETLS